MFFYLNNYAACICSTKKKISDVIKVATSIGFILTIDNMFGKYAPSDVKKGAEDTVMVFGRDQNTFYKLIQRYKNSKKSYESLIDFIVSIAINIY